MKDTARALAGLPDDARVYVPELGEVTLGEIRRATEQKPAVDVEREATLVMWEDIATRNFKRSACHPGASRSDVKAYHVSRFLNGQTPPRFS